MGGGLGDIVGSITGGLIGTNHQKEAADKARKAQERAVMEARRIASEQKPLEEAATLQTDTGGSLLGNLGLTVEADYTKKKTSALGGTTATVGLGFGNV